MAGMFDDLPDTNQNSGDDLFGDIAPSKPLKPARAAGAWTDNLRDPAAGVLKIGPTAIKGVADIARLLTGDRVGVDTSTAMKDGMTAIDEVVGSERLRQSKQAISEALRSPDVGLSDLPGVIADNPRASIDAAISTLGSMFLPTGAAVGAAKLLPAAGKVIPRLAAVAPGAVATGVTVGTGATQNAAETFADTAGKPMADRYTGAVISGAASLVLGKILGGGAEGVVARRIAGDTLAGGVLQGAKSAVQTGAKEFAQEFGEEGSNYIGKQVAKSEAIDPLTGLKEAAYGGTIGFGVGGASDVATNAANIGQGSAESQIARAIEQAAQEIADQPAPQVAQQTVAGIFADLPDAAAAAPAPTARQPADAPAPEVAEVAANQPAALDTRAQAAIETIAPQKAIDTPEPVAPSVMERLMGEGWTPPAEEPKEATTLSQPAPAATETIATEGANVQNPPIRPPGNAEAQAQAAPDQAGAPAGSQPQGPAAAGTTAGDTGVQAAGVSADQGDTAKRTEFNTPERAAENRQINAELEAARNENAGYVAPADIGAMLRKLGAAPTSKLKETEWEMPVGVKGLIVVKMDPATNRATVKADYLGEDLGQRVAEGAPAIAAAVEKARDGLQAGMDKMERDRTTKLENSPTADDPFADIPAAASKDPETQSQQAQAAIENVAPQRLGRNNTPLNEGGKPFKTKLQADTARKGQTMMRVIKVEGGYALADKTPAQLAAQEKASRRLGNPQTTPRGQAVSAHSFIADAGGLAPGERADMAMQGNVRIGNRSLFAGAGKGLTIERATEKLIEEGYLPEDAGHDQARALIKRSLSQPQYTPEGTERMALAEAETRFEDHLTAQQEAAAEDPDFDPFPAGDGWLEADLQEAGYDVASPEIQAEVRALIDMADAAGIDSESLMLDAHDATRNGTTQEYYEEAKSALEKAIAGSNENRGEDAGQPSSAPEQEPAGPAAAAEPGRADDGGLTDYTPKEVLDRLAKLEQAQKDQQAADAKADADAKKERERKDIASRQDASAENFELGQDADDSLSGQGSMFSRPAKNAAAPAAFRPIKTKSGATGFLNADIALGSPRLNVRQPGGDVTRIDFDIRDTAAFTRAQADGMANADAREAAHVGILTMDMDSAGQFKSLRNIEIFQSKRGNNSAEKVVGSIMASLPPGAKLHIHDILPTATGFWDKMGAKFPRSEDFMEAYLTAEQYKAAYDTRPRTAGARGQSQESRAATDGTGRGRRSGANGQNVSSSQLAKDSDRVSTPDQVRAVLAARFGPLAARMEARGFLKIWPTTIAFNESAQGSEKIGGIAQGMWDGKTAHLFADGIQQGDEIGVFLHEAGEHASMQKMLGPDKYKSLVARAHALAFADDPVALEAVSRIPDDTLEEHRDSELLAYMIETVANRGDKATPKTRKWLADVVAAIRAWWFQTGLNQSLTKYGKGLELTPQDIAALAVRAVSWKGAQSGQDADIQLSRPAPAPAPGGKARPVPASTSWTAPPGSPPVNPKTGALAPQPWNVAEPGTRDNFVRAIQNNKIDLKRVREAIEAQAGPIASQADAYLNEELYHGKVSARVTALHEQQVEPILKKIAVAGKNAGITLDDVNQYLHARHAPERNAAMQAINPGMPNNAALSGMSDADAAKVMADFTAAGKTSGLANIAADVDQLLRDTRTGMVADGLEDASTVQAWEQAYQHYAPLQRDIKTSGTPKGQGISVRGPEAKRAVGSDKAVVNILANIVAQAETAAIRAEKAIVGRALLDMARQYPNPGFWKVDAAPTKPRIDKDTGLVIRNAVDPMFQTADNVVMVKDYGIEHFIVFETKSERAMAVAKAMKNLEIAPMNKILEVASKGTRFIASLLTQRNPLFWMTNFARDIQGALINLQGTDAEGLQDKVLGNLPKAFKGMHALVRGTGTGQWARYAREIQEAGGTTGYMQQFENSDARMDDLKKIVAQMQQGKADPRRLARVALEFVDDYNDIIENAVRLSVFQAARDNGVSTDKAASIAKNITVNFNRKGNLTPPINALYMFFNASVQGTARLAQALATSRSAQAVVGGIAVMGFLLDALNRAMSDDDEETGRNRYDMIPEFEKSKNWIFMNPMRPGEYVKVPLPLGPHVFHNAGRFISDAVFRKNPRNASEYGWSMASTVLDAFSPLGVTPSVGQLIAPSILDPVVQLAENKSFTGGPVYRSDDMGFGKTDPKPAYTRHFESTPDIWKAASRALNDLSGGDKDKPGKLNVEPDILKHVFYAMTGGPGRMLDQTTDAVQGQARGEKPSVNRVPFVSRFYGENDDRQRERVYYDDRKRAMDTKTRFDHFSKIGRPDLAREVAEELGDGDLAKGRRLMREHASTQSSVRKLNKQIRAEQQKQQDGTDRSEQLRALKQRRVKVMGTAGRDQDDE